MKIFRHVFIKFAAAMVALAMASVVFTQGDVLAGGPCPDATLIVNKIADTNDGMCTPDDCSLREAVIVSNTCPGEQIIQVPAGTYVLTNTGAGEQAALTGDLDITDRAYIQGAGNPIIDGNGTDRVFEILPSATKAEIDGVTIQNGSAESGGGILNHAYLVLFNDTIQNNIASTTASGDFANGGGILSEGDNRLTMHNVVVTGNRADQGGGIMVLANGITPPTFLFDASAPGGASITGNTATQSGGGLWLDTGADVSLDMFRINKNIVSGGAQQGGGIYNASTLTLTHGELVNNFSGIYGGGIYNEPVGIITATDVSIASNLTRMGGGLFNKGTARFSQSAFTYNQANSGEGGAVYNFEPTDARATLTLENVTLSRNSGSLGGGGIANDGASADINFSTLAYNNDDGIKNIRGGTVSIRNSILASHSAGNCVGTPPVSNGFNLDDGSTCRFTALGDMASVSPLLALLANNGGWSPTHALTTGSPAIDSVDLDRCIPQDQREVTRPRGPRCDRGAYEKVP